MRDGPMTANMTYDPEADAVLIRLSDERPFEGEDAGPLIVHYAKDGRVVEIEILGASKVLAPGDWQNAPLPGKAKAHAAE
jgi:uncharacterized protein YuzE